MSFLIGPRQCGKTTLVREYLAQHDAEENYFNWDDARVQRQLRAEPYWFESRQQPGKKIPIAFDEIHKMRGWKNYLKGAYDSFRDAFFFIATGSGRLDLFQRGGDSLAGRYDPYRLYPLTPAELERRAPADALTLEALLSARVIAESTIEQWERASGFPEPFLAGTASKAQRWWEQYQLRVTQEDLRELTSLQSVDLSRHILQLIPARIGSPLSLNALREEVGAAHATVDRYVRSLQQLFMCFEVAPFTRKVHRAVKKEKKFYFYFHPVTDDPGARFENMIALLLAKWCSAANERALGRFELAYLRDQDRREVDFVITDKGKAVLLIEAKRTDLALSPALLHYAEALGVPAIQVVRGAGVLIRRPLATVLSIDRLAALTG
jgi:predicted AAA+ superfamily ATPase